ncbi:MAG: cyclic nucleotide-binding domain-containing protein, partial [Proteobacteria bacterium]|nr:cyclic nucleotide-binding domain-containing protein [Pseudomonadota bacterium]
AAVAFEQSEDFERASYCYERTGDIEKAKALRRRKSVQVTSPPNPSTTMEFPQFAGALMESSEEVQSPTAAPTLGPSVLHKSRIESPSARKHAVSPPEGAGIFAINAVSEANQTILDHDRALFHKSALFEHLNFQQRSQIWDLGTIVSVKPGDIVVDWSDEPPGLFFILEGEMNCTLKSLFNEIPLETIGPGETFGEICLLTEHPANVRFNCLHAARLLVIKRVGFLEILDNDGTIARKVYKHYTHRLLAKLLNPSEPQDIRHAI